MDSNREISATKVWRKRSWREKEINKLRERRRRAVTTKIFSGLRAEGNYNLSKYCGNFEILIALCKEAGWVVEEDGTTYRKVYKSALNNDASSSTKTTHFSSYQNPSPTFSFFPTPIPSYQFNPLSYPPMQISNNAPVTPSLHSPASTNLKPIPTWDSISKESIMAFSNYFQTNSDEWIKFQPYAQSSFAMPSSSSFNVVADNSIRENMGSSNMLEGEKIHDEGLDDLVELRVGTGKGPTSRNLKPIPTWDSISEESIMAFSNYFQTNSDQWIKFQPSAQSSFAMLSSSSFNDVADNSIRENMGSSSMFGEQVKSCVGEKVDDEGIDDLVELRLGIGKGKN